MPGKSIMIDWEGKEKDRRRSEMHVLYCLAPGPYLHLHPFRLVCVAAAALLFCTGDLIEDGVRDSVIGSQWNRWFPAFQTSSHARLSPAHRLLGDQRWAMGELSHDSATTA
jgi:hypothetical protein